MSAGRAELAPVSGAKQGTSVLRIIGNIASTIGVPITPNRPNISGSLRKSRRLSCERFTS